MENNKSRLLFSINWFNNICIKPDYVYIYDTLLCIIFVLLFCFFLVKLSCYSPIFISSHKNILQLLLYKVYGKWSFFWSEYCLHEIQETFGVIDIIFSVFIKLLRQINLQLLNLYNHYLKNKIFLWGGEFFFIENIQLIVI